MDCIAVFLQKYMSVQQK